MGPTRGGGPGFPYDPGFDYRAFAVSRDLDGTLVGTNRASKELGLESLQAVRDLVARGRLPALAGDQPKNKRSSIPLWAVRGLAKFRRGEDAHGERQGGPQPNALMDASPPTSQGMRRPSRVAALVAPPAQRRGPEPGDGAETYELRQRVSRLQAETDELRQRVSRLQAENSNLRFAWAAMRESRRLLGEADRDREAALKHLRKAERRQSQAAEKTARAEALQSDALTVYVIPSDGSVP